MPIAANTAKRTMSKRGLPDGPWPPGRGGERDARPRIRTSSASGVAWKSPTTNGAAASVIAWVPRRGLSIDARRAVMKNAIAYAHQGRLGDVNTGRAAA